MKQKFISLDCGFGIFAEPVIFIGKTLQKHTGQMTVELPCMWNSLHDIYHRENVLLEVEYFLDILIEEFIYAKFIEADASVNLAYMFFS